MSAPTETTWSTAELPGVTKDWWSWSGVQGGLTTALLVGQARAAVGGLGVRSVHASFLRPVEDGGLTLRTEIVRRTAGTALTRSDLTEGGVASVLTTAMFGAVDEPVHQPTRPPDVAPPQECPESRFGEETVPFVRRLEIRSAGAGRPLAGGDEPSLAGWVRLREPGPDPWGTALVLLDALPPAVYALVTEAVPVPTVEFSVHFTDGIDPDADPTAWRLLEVRTEQAGPRWSVDSGSLFDDRGTLLASARQTRRLLRRP